MPKQVHGMPQSKGSFRGCLIVVPVAEHVMAGLSAGASSHLPIARTKSTTGDVMSGLVTRVRTARLRVKVAFVRQLGSCDKRTRAATRMFRRFVNLVLLRVCSCSVSVRVVVGVSVTLLVLLFMDTW